MSVVAMLPDPADPETAWNPQPSPVSLDDDMDALLEIFADQDRATVDECHD